MKRFGSIPIFIVYLLIFSILLSGCGSQGKVDSVSSEENSSSVSPVSSEESSSKEEAESSVSSEESDPSDSSLPPEESSSKEEAESSVSSEENSSSVSPVSSEESSSKEEAESSVSSEESSSSVSPVSSKESKESSEAASEPSYSGTFFDGAVFVGDSVTLGLRNFATSERNKGKECLGGAKFLAEGSMGYSNTLPEIGSKNSIHPRYEGKKMHIEDALALMKAKKVFIMLGMNDFCVYPLEQAIGNADKCINKIKEKNPGVEIYIESVTPTLFPRGSFNNQNIDKFNAGMKKFCAEKGYTYVDVASVMKDQNGALIKSYCGDPDVQGVHMSSEGCKAWVKYLNETYGG